MRYLSFGGSVGCLFKFVAANINIRLNIIRYAYTALCNILCHQGVLASRYPHLNGSPIS